MKKVLSVLAVSAFVLTANAAFAGGPGQMPAGCPDACQGQIDDLQSSQAQQNEQLGTQGQELENHEGRIKTLETPPYNPWYARVGVKLVFEAVDSDIPYLDETTDAGWGGALAFGREFGNFRAELELAHQQADFDNGYGLDIDSKVLTVMVNGYYDYPVYDALSVYGMVGMGFANIDVDIDDYNTDENVFAYKAGFGVSYAFAENMAADLGYEYLGFSDTDSYFYSDARSNNFVASFRYKF